jgi:1-acyl-sn-glycerol-3-phosphate acyltransferase
VPSSAEHAAGPQELTDRPVRLCGAAWARWVLCSLGWRVDFDGLPGRQGVIVVYPHTSNWDFLLGLLCKWAIGLPLRFWGKDSLFKLPLVSWWMRRVGGLPIDRSAPHGVVAQMARCLQEAREKDEFLWVALSPEGTRAYRPGWRSGFYHLALGARVPLGLAYIDYATRRIGFQRFIELSADREADIAYIRHALQSRVGRHPAQASPIEFL